MEGIVLSAVFEFLTYASADLQPQFWRDRHVTRVEQLVNVTPKQESVRNIVSAAIGVGANVRCFKNG